MANPSLHITVVCMVVLICTTWTASAAGMVQTAKQQHGRQLKAATALPPTATTPAQGAQAGLVSQPGRVPAPFRLPRAPPAARANNLREIVAEVRTCTACQRACSVRMYAGETFDSVKACLDKKSFAVFECRCLVSGGSR